MRKTYILIAIAALAAAALAAGAEAALIEVNGLVVRTGNSFSPSRLPKRAFAPVTVRGSVSIRAARGGAPQPLTRIGLRLDSNNRLETRGLHTCPPAGLADTTPLQARNRCPRAIVATGHVSSRIAYPGRRPFVSTSPLTVFNGPRDGRDATVVLHSYMQFPTAETYVVSARLIGSGGRGIHGYHLVAAVPTIAGGYGVLTHADLKIGRLYKYGGRRHSYVSARCLTGILFAHGSFRFADGTLISGDIYSPCSVRRR
jgi:hypothetical protein